jgi:hypothetical protein
LYSAGPNAQAGADDNVQQQLYRELWEYSRGGGASSGADDEGRIKMLYITPEKFSKSEAMVKMLGQLAAGGRLSRFIIDEAHCLSQVTHGPEHFQAVVASLYGCMWRLFQTALLLFHFSDLSRLHLL